MSAFTTVELEYLAGLRLGRLATVGPDGAPHVVPVGFRYNPETDTIDVGGHNMARSKKWRDIANEPRVAFVVDDVLPPWRPRMIEIRGLATRLGDGAGLGRGFDAEMLRITPTRVVSYGITTPGDLRSVRRARRRCCPAGATGVMASSTSIAPRPFWAISNGSRAATVTSRPSWMRASVTRRGGRKLSAATPSRPVRS